MIYRRLGWLLTAATGMSNQVLDECSTKGQEGDAADRVGEWICSCMFSQWIRQAGSQAGNMQRDRDYVG